MGYPAGDFFYHYTTREAAFEHILPRRELRLSPYTRMNDPLENRPWAFGRGPGPWAKLDADARLIWESAKLLALTVDAPSGYAGTAQPFGRGWARARMWEQYAENHAGVCLVFDRAGLRRSIVESLTSHGWAPPYYQSVSYTAAGPASQLLRLDLPAMTGKAAPKAVAKFVEQHHRELFFLKASDWETEHEYRFVVTAPGVEYVFVSFGDALRAVVVGERFPTWQRPGAIEACRHRGAEALRLSWASRRPRPVTLEPDARQDIRQELLAERQRRNRTA